PADRAALRDLAPLARRTVDHLVAEFYDHLLRFPELAALLHAEPDRLARVNKRERGERPPTTISSPSSTITCCDSRSSRRCCTPSRIGSNGSRRSSEPTSSSSPTAA